MSKLAWLGYALFLAGYGYYKYAVAAPPTFSPEYAKSVALLVVFTGVAPFVFALLWLKTLKLNRLLASAVGLLLGLVACVAGYAAYWAMVIEPAGIEAPLTAVAMRGIGWGLLQGGLAAIAANH